MTVAKILVVAGDGGCLELLRVNPASSDYEVYGVSSGDEACDILKTRFFDLAIMDLRLPERDGISVMEELHRMSPEMPVIIVAAHGSVENAVEAMRKGAFTYLTKPFVPEELLLQVGQALHSRRAVPEIKRLTGLLEERFEFSSVIARSEEMLRVLEKVSRVARTDCTVYIQGESGTGKELIAKAIHLCSPRKDNPFVVINCAAIPESLLESELFGHERGAFTGAIRSSRGLFAQAHEGTIFLDEIGDMPLPTQSKLLRVLQERQFYPIGSERAVEVDIRVIVATNKDLEHEVKRGRFREDLFYRIHVIPIRLPALNERREDIPLLADYYLKKFGSQMQKALKGFTPAAMRKLMSYDWPGNVRELRNTIEYAVAMSQHEMVGDDLILHTKNVPAEQLKPLKEARNDFEKSYLIRLLGLSRGNVSKAATLAGKYRADFYHLLKKHNLDPEIFKAPKK
ncbi:MAG TPA: sigma-54 dependent transcriptional regulator [Dissulfurispiraceae bacterium]